MPLRTVDIAGSRFGDLPGIPVGTRWADRQSMSNDHIHPPLVAGIYGRKADGARSVVLAGHYDDEDNGDTFTYIGSGGREPGIRFGPQTVDQSFENNLNQALRMSHNFGRRVRVIRGSTLRSKYAPYTGFRYDGLYTVHNPRLDLGPNGFRVCKFDFRRVPGQPPIPENEGPPSLDDDISVRRAMHRVRKKRNGSAPPASASYAPVTARWEGSGAGPSSRPRTQTANSPTSGVIEVPDTSDESSSADYRSGSPATADSAPVGEQPTLEDLGLESDDDEDQEDQFAAIDRVEREFHEVRSKLQELARPGSSPEIQKARKQLMIQLGDFIKTILHRKRTMERERFDQAWWENELWQYVAVNLPTEKTMPPAYMKTMYLKYKKRDGARRRKHATS